uniref:Chromosome 3 open reading frame 20 n=1 Tax=Naja naja TaxID=35670 RepID=A0A8C6YIX5_NAJNA
CCYIKDEMNELQIKAKAPKLLADMVHMLITWQRMGFHVPRGVRNIFEFTWDELIEIAPRKSFTGLYCPVVKFLPYEEAELASATTSRIQKVGATPSARRANYVTSLESQPMLMKFQKRSIHLLTELLKLKMKIMIDAVAGLLKIKGGGSSTGQDKESNLSDKFDPCPEARGKLREICRQIYPSGNIAVFQFPICCIGKTITFLFQDVPTQGLLGMFSPGHSCLSYSFKSSFSVALLMNQQGGMVRDKYGQLTHHWNWYSRKEVLQSLDFQINENLKLKVLSQSSMTITFAASNENLTLSLIRPGCLHGCKADKQLKNVEADEKEHWRRILIGIKRRFQKTTKQFINSILMISGIVIMLAKEEIPDGSPTLEPWAIYPMDCPIVLRKVLTKTNEGLGCKCVVKIPLITDLEFEKFITAPRDPQQVIVICVLSPQKHSYSPFFEWSVEQLYIKMQHGRPSPCIQSKHDSYRFLKYDLENPLNKTPPLLVQKHGVVPGMVVMYAGGKLLFGSCVFNGYSYSKKDLLKQINQVCLDCKRGHFLPQSFKFSHMSQKQCSYTLLKAPLVLL